MISVVIPTLNEAPVLPSLLAALHAERTEHETIVVDGGSRDATVGIAREHGARVVAAPAGREIQLCAGVREARGDILLFLHADSSFPAGGLRSIEAALLSDPGVVVGNFRLLFDGDTRFSRWLTRLYARIRRFGLHFNTKKVNSSDEAYSYGGPDSPINILAHALNLVLASTGSPGRARNHPRLPLLAAALELPQTLVAAKHLFYQIPYVDKAWCPYCITDALTHFITLGLLVPEARETAVNLLDRRAVA
jgi:glycosyltransferase involved in cell wall biosynthesis